MRGLLCLKQRLEGIYRVKDHPCETTMNVIHLIYQWFYTGADCWMHEPKSVCRVLTCTCARGCTATAAGRHL